MRYLSISVWNKPPIGLRKGQQVSVLHETTDGGENIYDYGEVAADQDLNLQQLVFEFSKIIKKIIFLASR